LASAQARALAESGLERALWGLTTGESNPGASGVLVLDAGYLLPGPMPPAYNGSPVALNDPVLGSPTGIFKVTVANGAIINEKVVTQMRYVPDGINSNGTPNLYSPAGYTNTAPCPDGASCGMTYPSGMILTDSDMATLKALAKSSGHYYTGAQHWACPPDGTCGNPIPNGLVFVDTPSGQPLSTASPASDLFQ